MADNRGRPVAITLSPGHVADITMAKPLVDAVVASKRLLADKAYDAEHFRNYPGNRQIEAVIPSTASQTVQYPLDAEAYKRRNVIERFFCKLKNWRRVATRYDRLARNYMAAIALAAIVIQWAK